MSLKSFKLYVQINYFKYYFIDIVLVLNFVSKNIDCLNNHWLSSLTSLFFKLFSSRFFCLILGSFHSDMTLLTVFLKNIDSLKTFRISGVSHHYYFSILVSSFCDFVRKIFHIHLYPVSTHSLYDY